jgi:hypothetical protein
VPDTAAIAAKLNNAMLTDLKKHPKLKQVLLKRVMEGKVKFTQKTGTITTLAGNTLTALGMAQKRGSQTATLHLLCKRRLTQPNGVVTFCSARKERLSHVGVFGKEGHRNVTPQDQAASAFVLPF